jgi:hypothetical protein
MDLEPREQVRSAPTVGQRHGSGKPLPAWMAITGDRTKRTDSAPPTSTEPEQPTAGH